MDQRRRCPLNGLTLLAFTGLGGVLGPSSSERLIAISVVTAPIVAAGAITGSPNSPAMKRAAEVDWSR